MIRKFDKGAARLAVLVLFVALVSYAPAHAASSTSTETLQKVGNVDVWASQSIFTEATAYYTNVHMVTQNGATMDSDELRGNIDKKTGTFTDAVATGNVVAHVAVSKVETYDISADKAVYDIAAKEIDLTGKVVKVTATTPFTKGPLVQTGDNAVVLLGPSKKYPQVTSFPAVLMNNVHAQFTPAEHPAQTTNANPG